MKKDFVKPAVAVAADVAVAAGALHQLPVIPLLDRGIFRRCGLIEIEVANLLILALAFAAALWWALKMPHLKR